MTRLYDPIEQERKVRDRRLVFICLTVITAVFSVLVMASDLFLRRNDLHYHGIDPSSYDVIATGLLIAWIVVAVRMWRGRK